MKCALMKTTEKKSIIANWVHYHSTRLYLTIIRRGAVNIVKKFPRRSRGDNSTLLFNK